MILINYFYLKNIIYYLINMGETIKYSYEYFNKFKNINLDIDQELQDKINYITEIINNNIGFTHYDKNKQKFKYLNKKKSVNNNKVWRIDRTIIKKNKDNEIDKYKYEINSLLNKLSPKNFDSIIQKILVYFNFDKEILLKFIIDNLFLKAVIQPIYCPYYVKFIKILESKFKINELLDIKCVEYKNILNNTNNDNNDNDNGLSEQEKYDKFCEENKNKIFKDGYTQFIGELFNNKLIKQKLIIENIKFFVDNFKIIMKSWDTKSDNHNNNILFVENIISCLYTLVLTTIKNIDNKKNIINNLRHIFQNKNLLSKKLQFKLLDLNDLIS